MKEELSPDCYFIHLANCVKMKSPDPKTKKGAVLASDDFKVKSTGYNDVPKIDNNILDW
jgi:deoxycytidylate deaminase